MIELATQLPQSFVSQTKMLLMYLCVWKQQPFEGNFLFGIGQHNLFKYFDVFKLIHNTWNTISSPNTVVWKTSPYQDFCTIMLHSLHSVLRLKFSTRGSSDILSMTTRSEKNSFTLFSPQNVMSFLFGPIDKFLGKFELILHMPFCIWCFTRASCWQLSFKQTTSYCNSTYSTFWS